jgi:hypothetical protein
MILGFRWYYLLAGLLVVGFIIYVMVDYFSADSFKAEDVNPDTDTGENFSAKNIAKTADTVLDNWFGYQFQSLLAKLAMLNDNELAAVYNKFNEKYGESGTLYAQINDTYTVSTVTETRKELLLERMTELGLE